MTIVALIRIIEFHIVVVVGNALDASLRALVGHQL
jgi:hypothetical protein